MPIANVQFKFQRFRLKLALKKMSNFIDKKNYLCLSRRSWFVWFFIFVCFAVELSVAVLIHEKLRVHKGICKFDFNEIVTFFM